MLDYNVLDKILARHTTLFGKASVTDVTAFETTAFNFIFFFRVNEKNYVLKVMKKGAKNEFSVMSEAKKHILVPEPLSYGVLEEGEEYLLMERASGKDGKTLLKSMNRQDTANFINDSARILAKVHRSTFNIRKHDKLESSRFLRTDDVRAAIEKWDLSEVGGLTTLKAMEQDQSDNCVLVHGRFTPSNIMVHMKKISGVVDWSESLWGSPYYDLGYTLFVFNALGLDASMFLRMYKEEWFKPVQVDIKREIIPEGLDNLRELLPYYETLAAVEFHVLGSRIKKNPKMVEIINHPENMWALKVIESADRVANKL